MAAAPPVRYRLAFPDRAHHYVEVAGRFPTAGRPTLELVMAVWTPGSYLVREFARHVEALSATAGGEPVAVRKSAKNRWQVATGGADEVVVRYRLYARTLSVHENYVGRDFALLNGAATFLAPAGDAGRAYEIEVERPAAWRRTVVALTPVAGTPDAFRAASFDALVDAPIYLGNAPEYAFEVAGRPHLLVDEGEEGGIWDGPRAAAAVERIVHAELEFWGELPYQRYLFLNLITESSGGLEHADSTLLLTSRWRARTRAGWLDWLTLVAHELFHAWNVKRLRPLELGPFDYEREVYTSSLWIAEGLTSYYDTLLVRRAGLCTDEEHLKLLAKDIETVETGPGRLVQSLADASFDAWIKFYRPDENARNARVSYYKKGAAVGFLLDAAIRRSSGGRRSLDDALRAAYRRHAGEQGFAETEFRALLSEAAGHDLGPLLAHAVDSTAELDYRPALDWFGLRFAGEHREPAPAPKEPEKGWLGARVEPRSGRLLVAEVLRDAPARSAGLEADDELLAIGGFRVPPEAWPQRLEAFPPGSAARLLVARRERLLELDVVFGREPDAERWQLEPDPAATPEQRARLREWLGPEPDNHLAKGP